MTDNGYSLLSDEPAVNDLLSFDAVAATVVDPVHDDSLDRIALGLSGSWGRGKTSVLELVPQAIVERSESAETKGTRSGSVLAEPGDPGRAIALRDVLATQGLGKVD